MISNLMKAHTDDKYDLITLGAVLDEVITLLGQSVLHQYKLIHLQISLN